MDGRVENEREEEEGVVVEGRRFLDVAKLLAICRTSLSHSRIKKQRNFGASNLNFSRAAMDALSEEAVPLSPRASSPRMSPSPRTSARRRRRMSLNVDHANRLNESLVSQLETLETQKQREERERIAALAETAKLRRELTESSRAKRELAERLDGLTSEAREKSIEAERATVRRRSNFARLEEKLADMEEERDRERQSADALVEEKRHAAREGSRLRKELAAQSEAMEDLRKELNAKRWRKATSSVVTALRTHRDERRIESLEADVQSLRTALANANDGVTTTSGRLDFSPAGGALGAEGGGEDEDEDEDDDFAALFAAEEEEKGREAHAEAAAAMEQQQRAQRAQRARAEQQREQQQRSSIETQLRDEARVERDAALIASAIAQRELDRAFEDLERQIATPIVTPTFVRTLVREVLSKQMDRGLASVGRWREANVSASVGCCVQTCGGCPNLFCSRLLTYSMITFNILSILWTKQVRSVDFEGRREGGGVPARIHSPLKTRMKTTASSSPARAFQ